MYNRLRVFGGGLTAQCPVAWLDDLDGIFANRRRAISSPESDLMAQTLGRECTGSAKLGYAARDLLPIFGPALLLVGATGIFHITRRHIRKPVSGAVGT